MGFLDGVYAAAKRRQATIILAEAEDPRVLDAAAIIEKKCLARLILLGDEKKVRQALKRRKLKLKAGILSYANHPKAEHLAREMVMLRRHKGLILDEAKTALTKDTKTFAAMLVQQGYADGYVAGSLCPTADTIRPALQLIGAANGFASSYFVMLHRKQPLFFADCAFNVEPTAEQLARIAVDTAKSAEHYGVNPKVAFLSFSTRGSGRGASADKMRQALALAQKLAPSVPMDGELQFDAAFVPDVAKRKAKGSDVAGKANVFIFPDLDSGNIAYKIAERMGGCQAIGPVVQGLKKPVNDLSRGCSVKDIVDVVAITASHA